MKIDPCVYDTLSICNSIICTPTTKATTYVKGNKLIVSRRDIHVLYSGIIYTCLVVGVFFGGVLFFLLGGGGSFFFGRGTSLLYKDVIYETLVEHLKTNSSCHCCSVGPGSTLARG